MTRREVSLRVPKHLVQGAAAYIRTYSTKIEQHYQYLARSLPDYFITIFSVQARTLSVLVVVEGKDIQVDLVLKALWYILPRDIREHVKLPHRSS